MAFKEVLDLSCDTTISLGGMNKKTGKANPTKIEGYYLGKKEVEDRKKKSGISYIYAFQTPKGNIGVWGKTDLDRKMLCAPTGAMLRVTQSGIVPTPNGDMYKYKVEVDVDNTIDVPHVQPTSRVNDAYEANTYTSVDEEEESLDAEEIAVDELTYARPKAPTPKPAPSAERVARVQALLSGARKNTA